MIPSGEPPPPGTDASTEPHAADLGPGPAAPSPSTNGLLPLVAFTGLLLLLIGGACGMGFLLAAAAAGQIPPETLGLVVALGSASLLALMAGYGLARGARSAMAGQPARRFGPAGAGPWLTCLLVGLPLGWAVLRLQSPLLTLLVFPPIHVTAAILPALACLGYVAGRGGRPDWLSWRGLLGRLVWGALLATGMAMVAEALLGMAMLVIVALAMGSSASGRQTIEGLQALAQQLSEMGAFEAGDLDPSMIAPLLHPAIVLGLFLMLALLGPLVEELAKLLGLILRPPSCRAQAWAWGVACGAGFGILESVFFGAYDLTASTWPAVILVRAVATVMHATMTGLAALGWYALRSEGRLLTGPVLIGLAVAGHGLWNGLALATGLFGLLQRPVLAGAALLALFLLWTAIFLGFLSAPTLTGGVLYSSRVEAPLETEA